MYPASRVSFDLPPDRDKLGRGRRLCERLQDFLLSMLLRKGTCTFSSPEPTILLACGRNQELWEQPFWNDKGNNRILPIRFNSVFIYGACPKWLLPELSIPAAGRKDSRLWGREWTTHRALTKSSRWNLWIFYFRSRLTLYKCVALCHSARKRNACHMNGIKLLSSQILIISNFVCNIMIDNLKIPPIPSAKLFVFSS